MEEKKSILSSEEQRKAVQRTMGHKSLDTTYGYSTDLDKKQIEMAENDSNIQEKAEIDAIKVRAAQLKPIEKCVKKCVLIAKNGFKI